MGTPLDVNGNPITDRIRCGWWYDENGTSTGALGTAWGPFFKTDLATGGKWMWNLGEADKAEDIKACKKMSTCANATAITTPIGSSCGFCWDSNTTGHGVPIAGGAAKYSDASCGNVITSAGACTATRDPPPPQGGGNNNSGSGSSNPCDPSNFKSNWRQCLATQARQAGMQTYTNFYRGIALGESWDDTTNNAIYNVLSAYYRNDFWSSPIGFLQWCNSIVQAQNSGATNAIRVYARYLVKGGTAPDPCPKDMSSTTYSVECMQRAFRQAGCQPAGSDYPNGNTPINKKWGDLTIGYTVLEAQTKDPMPPIRKEAIQKCLGITVPLPPPGTPNVLPTQAFTNPPAEKKEVLPNEGFTNSSAELEKVEGFGNTTYGPFALRLDSRWKDMRLVTPGPGEQGYAASVSDTNPAALFMWTPGSVKDSIRILPQSRPGTVFRHYNFQLRADADNTATDPMQAADSMFFVRTGNAGEPNSVSFESVNFPGRFLRHWGFRFLLHPRDNKEGNGMYNGNFNVDSTFVPVKNGNLVGISFFRDTRGFDVFIPPNTVSSTWNEADKVCADKGQRLCSSKEMCPSNQPISELNVFGGSDNWMAVSDKPNQWVTYNTAENRTCKVHDQVVPYLPGWGNTKDPIGFYRAAKCCPKTEDAKPWTIVPGWCEAISIGYDGFICCVNAYGNAYYRYSMDHPWEYAGGGLISIDCGHTHAIYGTFADGTVRHYRGNFRWEQRGARPGAVHTAVASNGTYATMIHDGNNQFSFENYGRPAIKCLWISLGPTENDVALVTPDRKVFLINARNPQGITVENPPGLQFAKAFISKSNGNEVLAVTTTNRIFAIDLSYKWSELKNPYNIGYVGSNQDRIVGSVLGIPPQTNIYIKELKKAEEIPKDYNANPYTVNNGNRSVAFSNKGLGQVMRECRETPGCAGFNYAQNGSGGNLVLGTEGTNSPSNTLSYYKKDPNYKYQTGKVTFYSAPNFSGRATELDIGDYPFGKLMATGYVNDSLQSVKVPPGLAVIMWEHNIGQGREVRLTSDNANLSSIGYANTVSTCRVIAV